MKERPILFTGPMVRALLDGSKTQTRRVVKPQPYKGGRPEHWSISELPQFCPYGKPGDWLWVRETWAAPHSEDGRPPSAIQVDQMRIHYAASEDRGGLLWRPSIHMPRWASRITLEVISVRVERLGQITEADAKAEGCEPGLKVVKKCHGWTPYALGYSLLWDQINGPGSWDVNPWVWVVEFKRCTK